MSAPDSTSAARQSAKPAPVRSRSSFTRFAGICMACGCVLILFFYSFIVATKLIFVKCACPAKGPLNYEQLQNGPAHLVSESAGPAESCQRGLLARCLVRWDSRFGRLRRGFRRS